MRIQILIDKKVVSNQDADQLSIPDAKLLALKAALANKELRLSESLRATFRVLDAAGNPIDPSISGPAA